MFEDILNEELQRLVLDIIEASRNAGQEASGRTYQNITHDVTSTFETTQGRVWAPDYFYTLIRGRGPGAVPYDFEEIIKDWAAYKGITFESIEALNRFANAVKWIIKREGSQLYRNNLYVDIADTPIDDFERRLSERVGSQIEYYVYRSLNADATATHGFII